MYFLKQYWNKIACFKVKLNCTRGWLSITFYTFVIQKCVRGQNRGSWGFQTQLDYGHMSNMYFMCTHMHFSICIQVVTCVYEKYTRQFTMHWAISQMSRVIFKSLGLILIFSITGLDNIVIYVNIKKYWFDSWDQPWRSLRKSGV